MRIIKKLDNIFFNTSPLFWGYKSEFGYLMISDNDIYKFVKLIRDGLINIYEYEYDLWDRPTEYKIENRPLNYSLINKKEETIIYSYLCEISKCRENYVAVDLYWNAYNVLKQEGYTLKNINGVSNYMKIHKLINDNKILHKIHDISKRCGDIVEGVILRCGDIDAYRAIDELTFNKYLIIFPYIKELCFFDFNRENIKIGKMYTLEMTDECRNLLEKERQERRKNIRHPLFD